MNTITKIYILNKAKELILKGIYKTEITEKTKKGIEKLDAVADGFWDKLREYVRKEKEIDRKFIPNSIEEIGEEILEQGIEILSKEFDIKSVWCWEKRKSRNILIRKKEQKWIII